MPKKAIANQFHTPPVKKIMKTGFPEPGKWQALPALFTSSWPPVLKHKIHNWVELLIFVST